MGWKADVNKLKSRANELKLRATELKTQENALNNIIDSSRSCWDGEAADIYRKQVSNLSDKIKKTRNKLNSSADDLIRIASQIQSIEDDRANAAREL